MNLATRAFAPSAASSSDA